MTAPAHSMSGKRNLLAEITAKRKRRNQGRHESLLWRLGELDRAFARVERESEALHYFIVAIVACLEGYVRERVAEFLDKGQPYLGRAAKLELPEKWNFDLARAIHDKDMTIGEFVAHQLKISQWDHVHKIMTTLIGKDFCAVLSVVKDRWSIELEGGPDEAMLADPARAFMDAKEIFEARHIICHEMATAARPPVARLERLFENAALVLRATDALLCEVLYPNYPLTQTDMNIAAGANLQVAEEALERVEREMREQLGEAAAAFDSAQGAWRQFCEAELRQLLGEREGGGTIWPTLYCAEKASMVEQRTVDLRRQLAARDDI